MATRQRARAVLPLGVRRLGDEIEHWRRTRARRTAMPTELWSRAVALASEAERPFAIARALRIDFGALKRRMAERAVRVSAKARSGEGVTFVELTGAELLGQSLGVGAVVEMSDETAKVRVTVRLANSAELDVAGLVAAFRRRSDR